ncbi:MAG: dTDP-4-dehydrorhamnose 3,5-epimerase [Candidatus Hydrogenedentota bacterium]|nr:MAG: dTDP-4-dehydrorhamnose 3,5-epimerase [Candidatus Hydrogenedentota bacterium]
MPVSVQKTDIPDVLVIESPIFQDDRGYFTEVYNTRTWGEAGFADPGFVQDNMSVSQQGTLRGLHYQMNPHGQGKLVRALHGSIFDVAVDLRKGSPTFGKWVGQTLTEENGLAMWVPVGFAHGFLSLADHTRVLYKCTSHWEPNSERAIRYDDPAIGIAWPETPSSVNEKDLQAPLLSGADYNFTL